MKEKDLDKDTIVAYHAYLQTRIHNELNATGLGPARFPWLLAQIFAIFSCVSCVVGVLVIVLRHRHVYLVDWWHAFLGPSFIIIALVFASLTTYLVVLAKRRANQYRRELYFRPIGDYGIAVVHKSTLMHEEEHRSDLKSGTAPHRSVLPHSQAYGRNEKKDNSGHENRGYNDNGYDDRHHKDRERRRPDDRDRRHPDDRDKDRRRRDDRDRERRRPDDHDKGRRRPDDGDRRRPDDGDRRRPDDGDRRRPDDGDRRRPEDRERRPQDDRRDERRRPANIPRDEKRGETEKHRPPRNDDQGEREKRQPPRVDDGAEREKYRPDDLERPSPSSHGGRRAVRGLPKIAVTEGSQSSPIVMDADFGQPAGHGQGESEL